MTLTSGKEKVTIQEVGLVKTDMQSMYHSKYRAGGNGPAAPVLAGPVFSS